VNAVASVDFVSEKGSCLVLSRGGATLYHKFHRYRINS